MIGTGNRPLQPVLHGSVFVAEGARIYGDVSVGKNSSIWFNAVLRGDEGRIEIGEHTNIQDNVTIHTDMGVDAVIGDRVTIGHGAVIRACRIECNVMIGMNATVMTHACIGHDSIVGANALIPYRKSFPPRSLIIGMPARVLREMTEEEIAFNRSAVAVYADLVRRYTAGEVLSVNRPGE